MVIIAVLFSAEVTSGLNRQSLYNAESQDCWLKTASISDTRPLVAVGPIFLTLMSDSKSVFMAADTLSVRQIAIFLRYIKSYSLRKQSFI